MDIRSVFASCLGGQIEQSAPQAEKNPANLGEAYQPSNSTQQNSVFISVHLFFQRSFISLVFLWENLES